MFAPIEPRRSGALDPVLDDASAALGAPSGLARYQERSVGAGAAGMALEQLFPTFFSSRGGATTTDGAADGSIGADGKGLGRRATGEWRGFPTAPFYGLLKKIHIDIGLPAPEMVDSPERPSKAARGEGPGEYACGVGIPPAPAHTLEGATLRTSDMQDIVERTCGYFRWGDANRLRLEPDDPTAPHDDGLPPAGRAARSNASTSFAGGFPTASELARRRERYASYVEAMMDAYRTFRRRAGRGRSDAHRAASPDETVPHFRGFYVLCHQHPRWKSFSVMFAEENDGQQMVTVAGESPSLQRFLKDACADAGALDGDVEWLDGAMMLPDTVRFGPDRTSALDVIFDAILNIEEARVHDAGVTLDPATSAAFAACSSGLDGDRMLTEGRGSVLGGPVPLFADHVCVLAPYAFHGGTWQHFDAMRCTPVSMGTSAAAAHVPASSWIIGDSRDVGHILLPSALLGVVRELTARRVSFSLFISPFVQVPRSSGPQALASKRAAKSVMHAVARDRDGAVNAVDETKLTTCAPSTAFTRLSAAAWLSAAEWRSAFVGAGGDPTDAAADDGVDAIFFPVCLQSWADLPAERRFVIQNTIHRAFID